MPRRIHPGRPGTQVIPADWDARLAPANEKRLLTECEVRGPAVKGVASTANGARTTTPGPLRYSGPCLVTRLSRDDETADLAGQTVRTAGYLVTLLRDCSTVQPGDAVTVTRATDPRLLAGKLTVSEVGEASLRLERDLWCTRTS